MTDDSSKSNEFINSTNKKNKILEIKINYIKNDRETSEEENNYTLARFVSLFAQIGIAEMRLCNN